MKNRKLSARAVVSLMLSAILFCMPIGAFFANRTNTIEVHAEDTAEQKTESASDAENTVTPGNGREENSGTDTGEGKTENSTEGTTEDSSEETQPAAKCTCKEKCSQYAVDEDCEVCAKNYKECTYINPSVKITINTPSGWHNDTTKVTVKVEDTIVSGNFTIQKVQAKVGQNGSWTDITEDMHIEISENSTIYVQVTDQKGKTYEKNRYIKCFDFTKPTLNAAVSDGLLSIQAHDTDSGIKAIYVNGYEFTEHTNGALNIRLQQFDAGYQYFTISAMDNAGNTSEIYKTANPYYTDPENKDSNEKDPAQQLPVDASATKPSSATAQVTEHTKTDVNGNTVSQTGSGTTSSSSATAKQSPSTGDTSKDADQSSDSQTTEKGKEFYTIQTASEKVFYLVIDRDRLESLDCGQLRVFATHLESCDLAVRSNFQRVAENGGIAQLLHQRACKLGEGITDDDDLCQFPQFVQKCLCTLQRFDLRNGFLNLFQSQTVFLQDSQPPMHQLVIIRFISGGTFQFGDTAFFCERDPDLRYQYTFQVQANNIHSM